MDHIANKRLSRLENDVAYLKKRLHAIDGLDDMVVMKHAGRKGSEIEAGRSR